MPEECKHYIWILINEKQGLTCNDLGCQYTTLFLRRFLYIDNLGKELL